MNKTALVTGASSGIGQAFSQIFAAEGYNLVLVARSQAKLEQIAAQLRHRYSVKATVLAKDLSEPASPGEIFEALEKQATTVDILVNSAGFGTYGEFASLDLKRELEMLQVDVVSLVKLTRLFLPGMLQRGFGRILNVGSTGSFAPVPLMSTYGGAKAFVLSFSEGLSEELKGTPVRVTALCPGVTLTGFQETARVERMRLVRGLAMSAEQVARIGYKALMRGQAVVVPGFANRLMAFSVRFTPRWLARSLARRMMEQERS
jgi:short-subunit dehydrogenase